MSRRPLGQIEALARRYRATGDRQARNDLVDLHLDIADVYARRYARRTAPEEDLRQVGLLAMVRAVDRYDPDRGVEFSTFASRTIEGEMKRYLRDHSHSIRPPRTAQEINLAAHRAHDELTQQLGRTPTVAEIATKIDAHIDHVIEALEVGATTTAIRLDAPMSGSDESITSGDRLLGAVDAGYERIEHVELLNTVLADISEQDRMMLEMRYVENLSQQEIADHLGISQSYLSRKLRRVLTTLRDQLSDPPVPAGER